MSKINELRTQRAKAWEQTKAFLDSHRNEKGILSAEDTEVYERMEQEIVDLGHEIERQERMDAMERELIAPTSAPITAKPDNAKKDEKKGRASDAYKKAFWDQVRSKDGVPYEVRNMLSEGTDSEGGYLVPDEFEHTLIQSLEEECVVRNLAHVFTTSNGLHKIPIVSTKGLANWIDEGQPYGESDDVFGAEQNQGYISLSSIKDKKSITLKGKIQNIGSEKLDEIFEKNSYMQKIYPEGTRDALEVFRLYEAAGEFFDISDPSHIERGTITIGNPKVERTGYYVGKECIGCKLCFSVCPQKCIDITKKPVEIDQNHCLHCGKCAEICPKQTIKKVV